MSLRCCRLNYWPSGTSTPDHEQQISCPWDAAILTTPPSGTSTPDNEEFSCPWDAAVNHSVIRDLNSWSWTANFVSLRCRRLNHSVIRNLYSRSWTVHFIPPRRHQSPLVVIYSTVKIISFRTLNFSSELNPLLVNLSRASHFTDRQVKQSHTCPHGKLCFSSLVLDMYV